MWFTGSCFLNVKFPTRYACACVQHAQVKLTLKRVFFPSVFVSLHKFILRCVLCFICIMFIKYFSMYYFFAVCCIRAAAYKLRAVHNVFYIYYVSFIVLCKNNRLHLMLCVVGMSSFKCQECGKGFQQESKLTSHLIHDHQYMDNRPRRYKCTVSGSSSVRAAASVASCYPQP